MKHHLNFSNPSPNETPGKIWKNGIGIAVEHAQPSRVHGSPAFSLIPWHAAYMYTHCTLYIGNIQYISYNIYYLYIFFCGFTVYSLVCTYTKYLMYRSIYTYVGLYVSEKRNPQEGRCAGCLDYYIG